MDNIDSPIL